MLHTMDIAPTISAYAYMYEQHDYNKVPLAPIGCAVMVYNKPDRRRTWVNRYYLETLGEHY